ncbi:hypothetical protein ON010_g14962 [Phytophthora cinnamomi]|nr:hypothetical protein ON010_g14962 [Phytophthora cinnamomi]
MEHQEAGVEGAAPRPTEATREGAEVDGLAARTAAMQLESAASPTPSSPGLRLHTLNPFEANDGSEADEPMPSASPVLGGGRVAAAPALPQPPRFAGRTMQDRILHAPIRDLSGGD